MILDILLASAAALVNLFVLYTLYTQQGFPDMFNSLPGLVSAGLTAASATYLIIAAISQRQETMEDYEGEEASPDAGFRTWQSPRLETVYDEGAESMRVSAMRGHDGDGDLLARAVARAIEKAELKGDIGFHISIPEHEIDLGGHKASIRGQMVLETQPPPAKKEEPETRPLILSEPPSGDPVKDFLKRKLSERGVV